ncbi:hypothetical protein FHR94_003200 [Halomonas cerina]|uniref:Uncharacterized protein n=1 Tax=Halomonas cerina TaxID=447424 RepID=A0A839VH31_9GAMM|nr:hypothetical protein [Halomonas cerina]
MKLAPPTVEHVMTLNARVEFPLEISELATGKHRNSPIDGGAFEWPMLSSEVLVGGEDWQMIRTDGCADIMASYTFSTRSGSLVEVESGGVRNALPPTMERLVRGETVATDQYYFRN